MVIDNDDYFYNGFGGLDYPDNVFENVIEDAMLEHTMDIGDEIRHLDAEMTRNQIREMAQTLEHEAIINDSLARDGSYTYGMLDW